MALSAVVVAPSPVQVNSLSYAGSVTASGGTAPYSYVDNTGELSAVGLQIDGATGIISPIGAGTPLFPAVGTFSMDILITDSLLATLDVFFDIVVAGVAPQMVRANVNWKDDECQPVGRQMARMIFDAIQYNSQEFNPAGQSNQPFGLCKAIIYSVKFHGIPTNMGDVQALSLDIESSQNLMRVTLGVPSEMIPVPSGFIFDCSISGALPFYCDSTKPVKVTYNPATDGDGPTSIDVRLFFCNFDVAPYTLNCLDTTTD